MRRCRYSDLERANILFSNHEAAIRWEIQNVVKHPAGQNVAVIIAHHSWHGPWQTMFKVPLHLTVKRHRVVHDLPLDNFQILVSNQGSVGGGEGTIMTQCVPPKCGSPTPVRSKSLLGIGPTAILISSKKCGSPHRTVTPGWRPTAAYCAWILHEQNCQVTCQQVRVTSLLWAHPQCVLSPVQ